MLERRPEARDASHALWSALLAAAPAPALAAAATAQLRAFLAAVGTPPGQSLDPAALAGLRDAVGAAAAAQGSGGRLDAERLVALLGAAGVVLTAEEDAALRTMLGCDGAGSVGADAFEAELVPPEPPAPPAPRLRRPDSAGAGGAPVALLECSDDALLELVQARPRRPGSSAARRS